MKKLFTMIAIVAATAFGTSEAFAQCCENAILTACSGACFEGSTNSVTVKEDGCYRACLTNSLCGSTGVRAFVRSGNRVLAVITGNNSESQKFCVSAGETITVEIIEGRTNPDIQCIWQGQAVVSVCPVITQ